MEILELTEQNFEHHVMHSEQPVIVDFYAPWCGPCKSMAPVLESLCAEHPNCKIGKVNVDKYPTLAKEFQVMSVPTFFLLKNGKAEKRVTGTMKKDALEKWCAQMEQ